MGGGLSLSVVLYYITLEYMGCHGKDLFKGGYLFVQGLADWSE